MSSRQLWVLSVGFFLAFAVLAFAVKVSAGIQNWDLQAALWANALSLGGFFDSVLVNASLYGREYFWIPVVAVLFLFGDRRTKAVALGISAVFLLGIVAGEVAKELVARPRPPAWLPVLDLRQYVVRIPIDTDFSYPSGHALIVSIGAAYSFLTFRRKWVAGLLAVEASVVCFSRVYTFEHFPTDVLGGILLGCTIALAGVALGRTYLRKQTVALSGYLTRVLRDGPLKI